MADKTKIQWSSATWNVVNGCSVVSPGCTNCYAMRLAGTRMRSHPTRQGLTVQSKAGPVWNGEVRFVEQVLDQPLRWAKPRMIFVCAHGDLFHESVPDEWIDKVFAVMALAQEHTFQVLTKRPERMRAYLAESFRLELIAQAAPANFPCAGFAIEHRAWPLPNVWLGTSVEDQQRADERIPILLDTPAALRWISAEPLLGPVDLAALPGDRDGLRGVFRNLDVELVDGGRQRWDLQLGGKLDWVVVGGESGPGARPFDIAWARSLVKQCRLARVPAFVKQLGSRPVFDLDGAFLARFPTLDRKGGDPDEWPADLRVREWPRPA